MAQNFNGAFPPFSNSNMNFPNFIQSGNYAIIPLQNLPFWNQQNNFYCPQ